jgi:intracellular sulfur oxidation DsrE/DsrF family protein
MITRRCFLALAACLLCAPALTAAAAAAEPAVRNRLVLQVSDDGEKKWNAVLNNVRNIQADLGRANIDIEVVAYGAGLGMLKADSLVANRVEEAMAEGVRFVACGNTMKTQKLTKDDMIDRIDYAQAGIVRLMQRQQQGWSYIRP